MNKEHLKEQLKEQQDLIDSAEENIAKIQKELSELELSLGAVYRIVGISGDKYDAMLAYTGGYVFINLSSGVYWCEPIAFLDQLLNHMGSKTKSIEFLADSAEDYYRDPLLSPFSYYFEKCL